MDKTEALKELKKSSFFRALTEKSRNAILEKWEIFSEDQIRKILFLTVNENLITNYLGKFASEFISETQKKALQEMVQKMEKANAASEEKILNNIIQDNEL